MQRMKKLLGILVLGLLWCNVASSSCKDDITVSITEHAGKWKGYYYFEITNPTKNKIRVFSYELLTAKGETMVKMSPNFNPTLVYPFSRKGSAMVGRGGLMTELVKKWNFECEYVE